MAELERPQAAAEFAYRTSATTFERGTDVDSCVSLAERMAGRFEAALAGARNAGAKIACKAGCSFCCHLRVVITPHEAIALFRFLSLMPAEEAAAIKENVLARAKQIAGMSVQEHKATNIPCAFLVDGRCSAYAVRPMACAALHSLRVENCEDSYHHRGDAGRGDADIPVLGFIQESWGAAHQGISAALKECGLDNQAMELHTAVAAILRNPAVMARWRSGRTLLRAES